MPRGTGSFNAPNRRITASPAVKIEEGEVADDEGDASSDEDVAPGDVFSADVPQSSPLPAGARIGPPNRLRRSERPSLTQSELSGVASKSSFLQYPPDSDKSPRRPDSAPGRLPSPSDHLPIPPSSQSPPSGKIPLSWESPFYKPYQYIGAERYPANVIPPSNPFENIAYATSASRTFLEGEVTDDPLDLSRYYGQERIGLPRWALPQLATMSFSSGKTMQKYLL